MLRLSEAIAAWTPAQPAAHDPVALLEAGWEDIVGPEVARNSLPARVAAGTLTITTRSSSWSHQLAFLGEHVLQAVAARVPAARIERLRFRVGRIARRRVGPVTGTPVRPRARLERATSASAGEALARFRGEVEHRRRTLQTEGWTECQGCGVLLFACAFCAACEAARAETLAAATARLLYDAPWLGYAGTAALVDGLQVEEYERIRKRMLAHWWGTLTRARAEKRVSPDGRERLIASSYVLLQSKLPPEEIMPATVRSILGDELHELLYGEGHA
jgi:hypothetical protein